MKNLSWSVFKTECSLIAWNSEHLKKKRCKKNAHKHHSAQKLLLKIIMSFDFVLYRLRVFFPYWRFLILLSFSLNSLSHNLPFVSYRTVWYIMRIKLFCSAFFSRLRCGTLLTVMKNYSIVLQYIDYTSLQVGRCGPINFQDVNLLIQKLDCLCFDFSTLIVLSCLLVA